MRLPTRPIRQKTSPELSLAPQRHRRSPHRSTAPGLTAMFTGLMVSIITVTAEAQTPQPPTSASASAFVVDSDQLVKAMSSVAPTTVPPAPTITPPRQIQNAPTPSAPKKKSAAKKASAATSATTPGLARILDPLPALPAPITDQAVAPTIAAPAIGGGIADSVWAALRKCEANGNYAINTGNGYYGAYQFAASTWRKLGYSGLPHEAPPAAQDEAARKLQAQQGWAPWPACTRKLGLR